MGGRRVRRGPATGAWRSRAGSQGPPPGAGARRRRWNIRGHRAPIPPQDVAQVSAKWPTGNVDVRMANYLCQAQQKWTIDRRAPMPAATPARPISRSRSPAPIAPWPPPKAASWSRFPRSPAAPEQLWRFDQLADGSWRIMPKAIPNSKEPLALSAVGSSFATLAKFDPKSEKQRWLIKTP